MPLHMIILDNDDFVEYARPKTAEPKAMKRKGGQINNKKKQSLNETETKNN